MLLRRLLASLAACALVLISVPAHSAFESDPGVCETTTTTGTGTLSLSGSAATGGYVKFVDRYTSGATVSYQLSTGTGASRKIEVGTGVFSDATPDTLTRATVDMTTDVPAGGTPLTLAAGTHTVCTGPSPSWFQLGGGDTSWSPNATGTIDLGTTALGWQNLLLQENDAGATGVVIRAHHDSASPADGDIAFDINVVGGADDEVIGSIQMEVDDGATTTEDTQWQFILRSTGADLTALTLGDVTDSTSFGSEFNLGGGTASYPMLSVYSNNTSSGGPGIRVYHDSASPADADEVGWMAFSGEDDAGNSLQYGAISIYASDVSNTTEDSYMDFRVQSAGSAITALTLGGAGTVHALASTFDFGTQTSAAVQITSTSAGTSGPDVFVRHNSTSPAANDLLHQYLVYGKDDGGINQFYVATKYYLRDPTAGAEDSSIDFVVERDGAQVTALALGGTTATFGAGVSIIPGSDATMDIGTSTVGINDLHIGSTGGVINWDGGDVTLTMAANKLSFAGGDFHIDDGNGQVVGHTAQLTLAEDTGGTETPELQILGTGGPDTTMGMVRASADAVGPEIILQKSRDALGTFTTALTSGDQLGMIAFGGVDDSVEPGASIAGLVDGTPFSASDASDMPGRLEFGTTADGAAAPTTRLTIKNDGGVIIGSGTTSPANDGDIRQYSADDSTTGPVLQMHHDDPSADANDVIARVEAFGAADDEEIGSIDLFANDVATGTEDTSWRFTVRLAGADNLPFAVASTASFGDASGADVWVQGGGSLGIDNASAAAFYEAEAGGDNFKAFVSAAANTADTTCTFENDANFIPDSCVGDGSDASDARLKTVIGPAGDVGSLLDQIKIYDFVWKETSEKSEKVKKGEQGFGPLAQELFNVNSDWVEVGGEDAINQPWTWKPEAVVPYLIVEAQNLRKRVKELEAKPANDNVPVCYGLKIGSACIGVSM